MASKLKGQMDWQLEFVEQGRYFQQIDSWC